MSAGRYLLARRFAIESTVFVGAAKMVAGASANIREMVLGKSISIDVDDVDVVVGY
jgi:hypothetical protein